MPPKFVGLHVAVPALINRNEFYNSPEGKNDLLRDRFRQQYDQGYRYSDTYASQIPAKESIRFHVTQKMKWLGLGGRLPNMLFFGEEEDGIVGELNAPSVPSHITTPACFG